MKAYDVVKELKPLDDGTIKYMLRNHMEPTVDNIYRARYSSLADANKQGRGYYQDEAGYYAKKAEACDWRQLQPQMEKVIGQAGLDISEETLGDARWLIEKGMPLTEESLHALYELKNLKIPETAEEIISAASAAIADGKKATDANIGDGRTALEKAVEYMQDTGSLSGEAVDKAVSEGKKLNLRILKACQMQLNRRLSGEIMKRIRLHHMPHARKHTVPRIMEHITIFIPVVMNLEQKADAFWRKSGCR